MPGIVGIISRNPSRECLARTQAMIGTLEHEPFYKSATSVISEMGIYAGWLGLEGSPDGIASDETGNISVLFSGECFADSEMTDAGQMIKLYQSEGAAFVNRLNGLFCGLLVDQSRRRAFLFNDRYGIQRIYFHEKNGDFYFASEAKALLRILPKQRQFDDEALADFLTFGCTLDWKTLFQGIQIMPGGSLWSFEGGKCRKDRYFTPDMWESQPPLPPAEFENRFQETFKRILPRYFASPSKIGIALTGGLDTRMIMACRPQNHGHTTSYTFSGNSGWTLDDKIAARIAAASNLDHNLIRLDRDFFADFAAQVDKTVSVTDGCAGLATAHEIYLNRKARDLAPIRLTGNYGSEILRGHSTFKPVPLSPQLFDLDWTAKVAARASNLDGYKTQPLTFAAFREIPWSLYGILAAGRSQVQFRTPYLDNELVALAFQMPAQIRCSSLPSFRLVRANNPVLGRIPTDRGFGGADSGIRSLARRAFAELTFRLDYYTTAGLPAPISVLNPVFKPVVTKLKIAGMHKFVRYSSWFRNELASYVHDMLASATARANGIWNDRFLSRLAAAHASGNTDYSAEINAVLSLEAIQRLLFRELPVGY